jgi:hypothetical protein
MTTPIQNSNVTFVTVFMDIYSGTPCRGRDLVWRFEKFCEIAETGIPLCVYVDSTGVELLHEYITLFPNIKIMDIVSLEKTWIYQICEQYKGFEGGLSLPKTRTEFKDTYEYMLLMNSKLEYLHDATIKNPFQTTHFAWIDFNISHVFTNNISTCKEMLRIYATSKLQHSFLSIPGCWEHLKRPMEDGQIENQILNEINWRFCGGFLMGDKQSIQNFFELYQTHLPYFIFKYRKIVWEVNFWAWLECVTDWRPDWFAADHNDSIIKIPSDFYSLSLKQLGENKSMSRTGDVYEKHTYSYPKIPNFFPCSSSYFYFDGKHILNTRYVNYTLTPQGYYIFHHPENKIISKNIFSILNEDLTTPECYIEIQNPTDTELKSNECAFYGMEDIRLFKNSNKKLGFISTSINYSNTDKNRMILGEYDFLNEKLKECKLAIPPNPNSWCEKNWIPICGTNKFIYKWSPFEIGTLDETTQQLKINCSIPTKSPICQKFRGSSVFVDGFNENEMIGVVHYSEGNTPRHYFHSLVILNKKTNCPLKYTQPFYFENIGIEFCIGFKIHEGKYYFWISQFDGNPALITMDVNVLSFCYSYF